MKSGLIIQLSICVALFGLGLYSYLEKQNTLTRLKMTIPVLAEEIAQIKEQSSHYRYEIDQFENPIHLMELARSPEFAHLKHPILDEVTSIEEGVALREEENNHYSDPQLSRAK